MIIMDDNLSAYYTDNLKFSYIFDDSTYSATIQLFQDNRGVWVVGKEWYGLGMRGYEI